MTRATGGLSRVATMPGWFVMWTMEGMRLVHATSGPFDTKKDARRFAVASRNKPGFSKYPYYLLKGGGAK